MGDTHLACQGQQQGQSKVRSDVCCTLSVWKNRVRMTVKLVGSRGSSVKEERRSPGLGSYVKEERSQTALLHM